jgi:hypothetical protein
MLSGQDGKVFSGAVEAARITRWKFATQSGGVAYASSATAGHRRRLPGVKHGSGRVWFALDSNSPIQDDLAEGDEVTLKLHIDADAFYSVPAVIETIALEVDIDGGKVIGGEFTFATAGAWTPPSFGE